MRVALLVNPESGSGDSGLAADALRARGGEVAEFRLDEVERALTSSPERLVVAGGDGTIGSAAAAAAGAQLPLAVVPVGTANDFARALGLPLDPIAAAGIAVTGTRLRRLDLAWIVSDEGRRPFVNVASTGLSPVAARGARAIKRLLGPVAYTAAAVRAGARARPVECEVECDGKRVHTGPAWQVSVASTGAFGGGAELDADPGDAELDVVAIAAGPRLRLIAYAYALRTGRIAEQRGVRRRRGRTAEVRTNGGFGFNVDGELVDVDRARFAIDPGVIQMIVG